MNNLAVLYQDQGQFAKAEPLFVKALEVGRRVLGEEHPDTLIAMNNLADAVLARQETGALGPLVRGGAEDGLETKLGPDHPDTLVAMANLGVNYRDAGRLPEGTALLEQAWEMARKRPGPLADILAWIPSALGEAYDQAGQFAEGRAALPRGTRDGPQAARGGVVCRPPTCWPPSA